MLEPLVVVYVGDETAGLDVATRLDQEVRRQVRLLTTQPDRLATVLDEDLPLFDTSGDVAAVPTRIDITHLDTDASPRELAETVLTAVLDATAETERDLLHGPFSYLAVDDEWRVVDWDPQLSTWVDWEPDRAIGTPLWDVFPAWEDSEFADACQEAMQWNSETSTRAFHGPSRKWLDFQIIGKGKDGIDLFALDVTEFQNAGGTIEGTSARFEETLDRITDAFFALDNQERFVFLNSQAEFLLDVDAKDVTGVRFWDAFPAAVSTTFYQEFNKAMETQEPTSFEEYYRPLDSWFEVNAYPSSEGLSVFLRDITERVELQEKLEQLHEVTRGLVVAESDREIAEQTIDATEEVLDFPMVAIWKHESTAEVLDPLAWSTPIDERVEEMEPLSRDSEFIWEVFDTGNPRLLGFVPATTNTSHHPGKVTSELLVRIGEYGVLGAYSDERDAFDETDVELFKLLASTVESAFRRAERERQLARRNERLNDFASVVSHDLRNPLNVASSHTELARLTDDPAEHLDQIEESMLRMEELIEDLLSRARGDSEIEREELSLAQIAREAWAGVDTADATLRLDGDGSLEADPDRIRQLFENLFRNAVEHGGASVTVHVGTAGDGFYVADDGPGIPEAKRADIFEQGVTHSDDGTGYGLAIVADIVDGHGWNISVTDSAGGGAKFVVDNLYSLVSVPEAD